MIAGKVLTDSCCVVYKQVIDLRQFKPKAVFQVLIGHIYTNAMKKYIRLLNLSRKLPSNFV